MYFSPCQFNEEHYYELQNLCPLNRYKVVNPQQLSASFPSELLNKSVKAVIVGSGSGLSAVYMVNFLRPDQKDYSVDQEPFMVGYYSGAGGIGLSAGFIHHGNWLGRTVRAPQDFFNAITGSGIEAYYPYVGVPTKEYGDIVELKPDSHNLAFWNGVKMIRISVTSLDTFSVSSV